MRAQLSLVVAAALIVAVGCTQRAPDANAGPSDAAIAANVEQKIASLEGLTIEVMAQDGVVRLSGTAPDADVKAKAVDLARGTDGVTDIVDLITVGPAAESQRSSAPAGSSVAAGNCTPVPVAADPIGYAPDIGESAGSAPMLTVVPATDACTTDGVKAALRGSPQLSGMTIDVVARDGVVTLSGTVESADAKRRAAEVAAGVANVTRVDNRLTVGGSAR